MKTKHKIITVITTIIIMVGLIIRPLGVSASSGTYNLQEISNLGQFGWYRVDNTGTAKSFRYVLVITLKAKYNGKVTITTNNALSNYDEIIPYNCEVDNLNNSAFQVSVYNSSFVSLEYLTDSQKTFSYSSNSLTKVADIDYYPQLGDINTKLTNVYNAVDGLENYANQVSTYCQQTSAYVALIQTETSDINLSVDNIESDVDTIRQGLTLSNLSLTNIYSDTSTIKTDLSSMLTSINSMATDISNGVADLSSIDTTLTGMSQNLTNLYARVNEINQNVADIEYLLNNSILPAINGITTAVNNIDSLIDTISWNNYELEFYWSTEPTADRTLWNNTAINSNLYKTLYIYFKVPTDAGNKITRFVRRLYVNSNTQNIVIEAYGIVGGSIQAVDFNIWYTYQRPITEIYIYPPMTFSIGSNNYLCCKVTAYDNNSYIYYRADDLEKGYISTSDIEYWQLLSYFNEYNYYKNSLNYENTVTSKLDDILTAINNIHINVTEQQIDNITNNFDNDITTIHNVELSFDSDFGDYNSSLSDSDITLELTPYSGAFSLVKTNITSLWQSDLIKIPILLSCLVFVFLVILG